MKTDKIVPEINYPTRIDVKHQGPKITVAAALCLSIAGLVLATRLLIRWPWRRLLGLDDVAAIVASVRVQIIDAEGERIHTERFRSSSPWVKGQSSSLLCLRG